MCTLKVGDSNIYKVQEGNVKGWSGQHWDYGHLKGVGQGRGHSAVADYSDARFCFLMGSWKPGF